MANKKPNIVFFFTDQQRWDTVGCYGQPLAITPNLDEMAQGGVRFENAFTCQPVCGPARACLQTGKYATALGTYRNDIALPLDEKTLAHYLKEVGYKVGYLGKWHLASTGGQSNHELEEPIQYVHRGIPEERRGGYSDYWIASDILEATSHGFGGHLFDENNNKVEFAGYRADAITDLALSYIKTWIKNEPHFLFISYIEPYHQNNHNRYEGPPGSREEFADFIPPEDLAQAPGDWGSDWQSQYPDYLGCCKSLDENLGRILKQLEDMGLRDDTIVIYTSDHGSHFKTRTVEYKRSCHEASIRIPLVIGGGKNTGDEFIGGRVEGAMVSLIDLPPTILQIAGIETPHVMQGRPIQKINDTKAAPWLEEIFVQISESQVGRCIRTKKYKYSVRAYDKNGWLDANSDTYWEEYLYDLEEDPNEFRNLISHPDYIKVRKELKKRLIDKMVSIGESAPKILPALSHQSVQYGIYGIFEDLVEHEKTGPIVKGMLPEGFLESQEYTRVYKMPALEATRECEKLLGKDFTKRLLKNLHDLEFNFI